MRKIPGVGKVTERNLHDCGIRKIGDLARLEQAFLEERFGKWGLALAGKARGEDAGGWFDGEIGEGDDPKSISHEHTFSVDTADATALEAMLVRLSEMVSRRLRDHHLHARTVQIKLRYYGFLHVHARAHAGSRDADRHRVRRGRARSVSQELDGQSRSGCWASTRSRSKAAKGRPACSTKTKTERWRKTLAAVDKMREKYGDTTVSLAAGLNAAFRARVHENPENLPGKDPRKKEIGKESQHE